MGDKPSFDGIQIYAFVRGHQNHFMLKIYAQIQESAQTAGKERGAMGINNFGSPAPGALDTLFSTACVAWISIFLHAGCASGLSRL
jgi:hypothetical protein